MSSLKLKQLSPADKPLLELDGWLFYRDEEGTQLAHDARLCHPHPDRVHHTITGHYGKQTGKCRVCDTYIPKDILSILELL